MNELTHKEILENRKAEFENFRKERLPVLHKFAEILGCQNPHEILVTPEKFLPYISEYMKNQSIADDNRIWILTRIGYFIGELFISKFDGCWMLDDRIESKTFSRYVIGQFTSYAPEKVIDPFAWAQIYVDAEPPRNLSEHVTMLEKTLCPQ